jgi:hypothetical protein
MYVRPHETTVLPLDVFSRNLIFIYIFRKSVEKSQVSLKSDENNSTLHEGRYAFLTVRRTVLLSMGNIPDRSCRRNQYTILCSITFL